MIYGQYPSNNTPRTVPLKSTFTLKSRIAFIKRVPPNTCVSYGRTHITRSESVIATVPIGYGDGYPRALSNKGRVVVRGKCAPVTGRICMDQLMIDTTAIPDAQVGDEVILYGGGYECLDAGVIANELNTISYELFCNISARVPRIYINE
jgi:alanine racemase